MTMVQCLSPWAILAPGWGKFFLLGFALSAEGVDRNSFEVPYGDYQVVAPSCGGVDKRSTGEKPASPIFCGAAV